MYEGNPVQEHIAGGNRDPKAIWYEPAQEWVIVLYLDENMMGFFTSKDPQVVDPPKQTQMLPRVPGAIHVTRGRRRVAGEMGAVRRGRRLPSGRV